MRLNYFMFVLFFMLFGDYVAGYTRSNGHHRLIERLEALEEEQRDSRSRIETLERTVKSQAKIIEAQSRDIKGCEFIVHKHRAHVQLAYRQSRLNRRSIMVMRNHLMDAGFIENKKSNNTSTETIEHHVTAEQDEVKRQELVDTKRVGHEPKHQVQGSIIKRHPRVAGAVVSKRQERAGVSFSVYVDHDVDLGTHQTIKFNQVIINDGNGYSIHSGVFTCPEGGVYLLSFFIGQRDDNAISHIHAELMVNSQNVIDSAVDAFHPTQDLQGGNIVVKRLKQGDQVWIDSVYTGGHAEGSTRLKLSSFSGVYLYA